MVDFKKLPEENERQYIYRIGELVDQKQIENWKEAANIINAELREDESEYRDESAYRKPYQYAKLYYRDVFAKEKGNAYSDSLLKEEDALFELKKQVQDQRREYAKLLTEDARLKNLRQAIQDSAASLNSVMPLIDTHRYEMGGENEAVICFSDWHYGMVCDNVWNRYNTDICRERVSEVVCKAKKYILENDVKTLHVVVLGDLIHGAIQVGCRVASEEDTSDQLINASEILAEAIYDLSSTVDTVNVYCTYGNHARTVANKKESVHSDNMEKIVPWWLETRFADNPKINLPPANAGEYVVFDVCGHSICAVHGDLDKFQNFGMMANCLFSTKFGRSIEYTFSGDKHHHEEFEQFGIESILIPSLCGTDEYANQHRLYSKPGQSLFIFNEPDGRFATYNIKL